MLGLIAALAAGIYVDWLLGDPPNKYHPVAWLGRLIDYCVPRIKGGAGKSKRAMFAVSLVLGLALAARFLVFPIMVVGLIIALAHTSAIMLAIRTAYRSMTTNANA